MEYRRNYAFRLALKSKTSTSVTPPKPSLESIDMLMILHYATPIKLPHGGESTDYRHDSNNRMSENVEIQTEFG